MTKKYEFVNRMFLDGKPVEPVNGSMEASLRGGASISINRWGNLVTRTSSNNLLGTPGYSSQIDMRPMTIPIRRQLVGLTEDGRKVQIQRVRVPVGTQAKEEQKRIEAIGERVRIKAEQMSDEQKKWLDEIGPVGIYMGHDL